MSSDETVSSWNSVTTQNEMQGGSLVIKGNNNSLSGEAVEGIKISNGQTLIIDSVGSSQTNASMNGFISKNGGAINNIEGTTTIIDTVLTNNAAQNNGGAINNDNGVINVIAKNSDVIFTNNTAGNVSNAIHTDGGTLNFNASARQSVIFNDSITSTDSSSTININASNTDVSTVLNNTPNSGTVVLNNDMSGYKGDVNLYHGTIKVDKNGTFFNPNNFNIFGCTLDFANGVIQNYNLGTLSVSDHVDIMADADLQNGIMDRISANNKITESGKINVSSINIISDEMLKSHINLAFADENLKDTITYTGKSTAYSPMYQYGVNYDPSTGSFNFDRAGGGGNYHSFNPSVFGGAVAAQIGGYLNQLNSYDQAFMNIDMKMLMTKQQRQALKLANKYAATGNTPMIFSPTFLPEQEKGAWVRPYTVFESVALKRGPRVSNVMYGTFAGVDSEMKELGHGFDGQFSLYAAYNGSHQTFDGVSLYQNGGTLGATGVVYKGNFFSALTANAGASMVDASNMYGSENFPMLMAGVASKTGYNWELADGKFIIQPSYLMSYTFVNAFNYRNSADIDIESDPLNAIQIAPGIKFIGNLKNGWQPYIGVSMIWNIIDQAKFKAADTSLPVLSVKPYVEYGVGLQKLWGKRFTGFVQAMLRNGGRNGIALSIGLRWSIGKDPGHN